MPIGVWRFLALAGALIALVFVMVDAVDVSALTDDHITTDLADGHSQARLRVVTVNGTTAENGGLRSGDIITPLDRLTPRAQLDGDPAGTTHRWLVQRGPVYFKTRTTVSATSTNDLMLIEIFNVVRLAMLAMAIVVAVRRPDEPAARALVTFLIMMAAALFRGGAWLPDPAFIAWRVLRGPIQIVSLSQGLVFACIFPFPSAGGLRAWLRRINPWYTLVFASAAFALGAALRITGSVPDLGWLTTIVDWSPLGYFPAILAAFWIAAVRSTGSDRQRVNWAAGSICAGFSGIVVATVLVYVFGRNEPWIEFLPLTLVTIPFGLAYTILRHRTVDVGFVISRALVLTILSFAIVAAFGLLERALGKLFIDASHIASRSVEIALALGLGFSLRSLHAQIERVVDGVFFRRRRHALAALKAFAVDVVNRCADATNTALYLIADGVFGCAAAIDAAAFPAEAGADDPLFVRVRASRRAALTRDVPSALDAEIAFPMFVRATLVGVLVLTGKRTGEAYDPEDRAADRTRTARRARPRRAANARDAPRGGGPHERNRRGCGGVIAN